MAQISQHILTAEDYLQNELTAGFKNEFIAGEVWAMLGASDYHVRIALNLATMLKSHLKESPCRTYISDMKAHIEKADAYFYPDVLVTCDERDQKNSYFKEYPSFIAEVLSPSTEAFDRGRKFNCYRQLTSLQCYWLIDSEKQSIDSFIRTENQDEWLLHSYSCQDTQLRVATLDFNCSLADIYEDIEV